MTTRVFALALTLPLSVISLHAEDWTTKDGKTYQEVSVVRAEPDAVTILHHNGGARVPLKNLPPELQKRFNFDPATAESAEQARAIAEEENRKALQAEMNQVAVRRQAALVAQNPNPPLPPLPENRIASPSVASNDPTHHGIGELVDTKKRLRDDHDDDTNHYSMGALKRASHSLLTDTDNSNHHAQGELFHSGSNLQ